MASSLEAVDQLPARELGELLLVVADLMDVEMREAGVLVLADQVEVRLGIGAGGRRLGDVGDGHVAGSLLEVARRRKLLAAGAGERAAVTCSVRFSPVPTPRKKRPGIIAATDAAAWATIAGWIRISGQVTPVPTRIFSVDCAIPPSVDQTNGLSP